MIFNKLKHFSAFTIFSLFLQIVTNALAIVAIIFITRRWTPTHGNRLVYYGTEDIGHMNNFLTDLELNRLRSDRSKKFLTQQYLQRLRSNGTNHSTDHRFDGLIIAIIASNRMNDEFIQVMTHFLAYLPDDMPKTIVCNTELRRPQKLQLFEPYMEIFDLNANSTHWDFSRLGTMDRRLQKEAEDYWKCLEASNQFGKDYVLVVEDDALPVPSIAGLIESLMRQLDVMRNIDYVKLYHPWSLRGIPWIFQSVATALTIAYWIQMLFWRQPNVICILATTLIVHLVNKAYYIQLFADLRFYLTNSAFITVPESCCTPAVLFRGGRKLTEMVVELSKEVAASGHAKDHILDESRFVGKQTDANLVVHIGFYSYLRRKTVGMDKNI